MHSRVSRKSYKYVQSQQELEIQGSIQKLQCNESLHLSDMEMQEVQAHAKTFGFIPEVNSIRYNYLQLRKMKLQKQRRSDMDELIYL